jgi:hypothetical protein
LKSKGLNGTVPMDNLNASFHQISAWPVREGDIHLLPRFKIACVYVNAAEQLVEGPWVEVGEELDDPHQSPPNGVSNSRYIQAFGAKLIGHNADRYTVSYQVHVIKTHVDRPTFHEPVGDYSAADGGWAGFLETLPYMYVWINRFTFSVSESHHPDNK